MTLSEVSNLVYPRAEADFSGLIPVTNEIDFGDLATEVPKYEEMKLRAETYERLQKEYLNAQVALQQERNRELELKNEREQWKRLEAESKPPVCRLHRTEYCLNCFSVSGGFSK